MAEAGIETRPQRDWPFEVRPLHERFGCEIIGLALADAVAPVVFDKVYEAFLDYQLILFRGVDLPPDTQVAFARRFGEVQVHVMNQYHGYSDQPEIYKLTNLDDAGKPNGKHPGQRDPALAYGWVLACPARPGDDDVLRSCADVWWRNRVRRYVRCLRCAFTSLEGADRRTQCRAQS